MEEQENSIRDALTQEASSLAARIEAQRLQAQRLRSLAERIDAQVTEDRCLLEDLQGQLGVAAQMRIDDFDRRLGGQRLERIAIQLLEGQPSRSDDIHYRDWLDLIEDAGYRITGKDPTATFLAQLSRARRVESVGARTGRYRLRAVA